MENVTGSRQYIYFLCCSLVQITIDNCVEVEHIATDLLLEDVLLNIGG